MENTKFIVALFKRDDIQIVFECDTRAEVDELVSNTLSKKDRYMYYNDEIIENFKKDDEDYDDDFYTGEGWYYAGNNELVWVPGEEERIWIDINRIDVFKNEEISWFKEKYPDVFLHAYNGNSFDI
jgi:hypothetical protein